MTSDFTIDSFRREDAEGISDLFQSVYGDDYPIKIFYDPHALTEANAEGRYRSIVARTRAGEVVGVLHLYRSAPYHALYEVGAGLVRTDYRQVGMYTLLLKFIFEEWVLTRPDIEETFGEAVCNHVYVQRGVVEFKHVETALEIALMPAAAYDKEKSAAGRVAGIMVFRCYRPKPQQVFLPPVYESQLRSIYQRISDARELSLSDKAIPAGSRSNTEMSIFDFAQVARIAFHNVGEDFVARIAELEALAIERHCVVFQVWVKLTMPWVGTAVDALRRNGYFFGGALPRWFDDDGLLMQKLRCDPNWCDIQLYSDNGRQLLAMIREDFGRNRT